MGTSEALRVDPNYIRLLKERLQTHGDQYILPFMVESRVIKLMHDQPFVGTVVAYELFPHLCSRPRGKE